MRYELRVEHFKFDMVWSSSPKIGEVRQKRKFRNETEKQKKYLEELHP